MLISITETKDKTSDGAAFNLVWKQPVPEIRPNENSRGYWSLHEIRKNVRVVEHERFIKTCWGQEYPWNQCVPFDKKNPSKRCKAGCVAVAGAQMIYFLKHKFNINIPSYTEVDCNTVNYCTFSNPQYDAWDKMALDDKGNSEGKRLSAILISDVGQRVETIYREDASSANTLDLPKVFGEFGVYCLTRNFSSTLVLQNFALGFPVVAKLKGIIYNATLRVF